MKRNQETNQTKAVALRYDEKQHAAPYVAAKGAGVVAEKIIEAAKSSGVPIQEDAALVELLAAVDLQETIPPELFAAVAEIFAFVYNLEQKAKE